MNTAPNGKKVALLTLSARPPDCRRLNADPSAEFRDAPTREVQLGGLSWRVRSAALEQVRPVCADIEQAIANASKLYKNSRNVTVASVPSSLALVVRRMNYGRLRHRFKDFFRPSRVRRAFLRGLQLEQAGVPTPRMLAVAEVRKLRWPLAAYLISDEVANAQPLAGWARGGCREARRVTERLATVIARMHERGFIHRDLKATNVLLDGDLEPWLIDMDGVRFVRKVSMRQVARDFAVLARVMNKRPQLFRAALRFLVCYCRQRGLMSHRHELARLVIARSGIPTA